MSHSNCASPPLPRRSQCRDTVGHTVCVSRPRGHRQNERAVRRRDTHAETRDRNLGATFIFTLGVPTHCCCHASVAPCVRCSTYWLGDGHSGRRCGRVPAISDVVRVAALSCTRTFEGDFEPTTHTYTRTDIYLNTHTCACTHTHLSTRGFNTTCPPGCVYRSHIRAFAQWQDAGVTRQCHR